MFARALFAIAGLLASVGVAGANPLATDLVRARQVPGTHHVQLTYGHDTERGGSLGRPYELKRDGVVLTPSWTRLDSGFFANTGCGIRNIAATQTCDCDVPLGGHSYALAVDGVHWTLQADVFVVETREAPPREDRDAGDTQEPSDVEVFPWDIPEPTQVQGLDCAVFCANAPVAEPIAEPVEDAGPTVDTTPSSDATPIAATRDAAGGGGGCSGGTAGAGLAASALLGLATLGRRRRRA